MPRCAGQGVVSWCKKAGCHVVGCYIFSSERMVWTTVDDPRAAHFNTTKVGRVGEGWEGETH